MKKVMVFGTFDIIHKGHENFFKQGRKYGDYLIAVLARDKTVLEVKNKIPKNNEKIRLKNIKNSGLADKAVLGGLKDKHEVILKYKPDVICLGYDQRFFISGLKNLGIKIVKLKPFKPEIYKSSKISKQKIVNRRQGKCKSVGAIKSLEVLV
jgi:cytidyltransferase-like protein